MKHPESRSKRRPKARPRTRRLGWKIGGVSVVLGLCALAYLDALVQSRFEGRKWALPAKVYARPLELYAGLPLSPVQLEKELQALGYQAATPDTLVAGRFAREGAAMTVATRGFRFWDGVEPPRTLQLHWSGGQVSHVAAAEGELAIARLEPLHIGGIYPAHGQDRLLVRLDRVPDTLREALILVEDRGFYEHHGISWRGIARALWANVRAGRVTQGGSTLTQQLVKNFYLTRERSLTRKGVEAVMAVLLEWHADKDAILETYLNEVYLGQSGPRAIHGFGLASLHYFNRPIDELRPDQMALLVGLVKGPSAYNPWRHPERARERRNLVLDLMAEHGVLDPAEAAAAKQRPLGVARSQRGAQPGYPAFMDLVRRQLRRDYRAEDLSSEGLRIFTTFDPQVQWQAEQALTTALAERERAYRLPENTLEGAVIVSHPANGEVQAVVGGRYPRYAGFNRALDAVRPVGSVIKPVVYLAALQRGYTLASLVQDTPVRVRGADGSVWSPENYDGESRGELLLASALVESRNQATVRLGMQVGVPAVVDTARQLGVERPLPKVPALFLGSAALSPLEVTGLYQTIAGNGFRSPLRSIREVMTADGTPLSRYPLTVRQTVDPATMFQLQYALVGVMREGTGRGAYKVLPADWVVAGKTGTTDDQRDSWFAGFSGDRLAVVWVGRDDNEPTPLTGATGALPVWRQVMHHGHQSLSLVPPAGVVFKTVDRVNGRLTDDSCATAVRLPFPEGRAPVMRSDCDTGGGLRRWLRRWLE